MSWDESMPPEYMDWYDYEEEPTEEDIEAEKQEGIRLADEWTYLQNEWVGYN